MKPCILKSRNEKKYPANATIPGMVFTPFREFFAGFCQREHTSGQEYAERIQQNKCKKLLKR